MRFIELIEKYPDKPWDWMAISRNPNISIDDINVKATTTEGMGFVGREEGECVYANIILDK